MCIWYEKDWVDEEQQLFWEFNKKIAKSMIMSWYWCLLQSQDSLLAITKGNDVEHMRGGVVLVFYSTGLDLVWDEGYSNCIRTIP